MLVYKRNGERYFRNGVQVKTPRVPQEVKDKLMYSPEVEFDEQPDKRRCIFCDAPQTAQRYLNNEMIDLCGYHYHNTTLGAVAAQVRLTKKEEEHKQWLLQNAIQAKVVQRKRRTVRHKKPSSAVGLPSPVATK